MDMVDRKQLKLTPESLVSVSLVAIFSGGLLWLSTIYGETHENSREIVEIKSRQNEYNQFMVKISNDLSEIKGQLKAHHE